MSFHFILDMRSGKVEVTKAPSRLCKANLYKRWLELCRKMELLYARPPSEGKLYSEVKVRFGVICGCCLRGHTISHPALFNSRSLSHLLTQAEAKAYEEAKELMKKSFKSIGGGNWVKKPMEQDMFEVDP